MQIDESNERASQRKSGWQTSPDYFPERPRTTVIYRRRPESSKAMKKSTWGAPPKWSQHWRVPLPGFANKCSFLRDCPPPPSGPKTRIIIGAFFYRAGSLFRVVGAICPLEALQADLLAFSCFLLSFVHPFIASSFLPF